MTVPLLNEAADPAAEIIAELSRSRGRQDEALRRAVPLAATIAPAVIEVLDKATDGVYLTPSQADLLFWGVHVLGAGRRMELCQPLLRLLRSADSSRLDDIFGDAVAETFRRLFISVFDGNADALIATIMDRRVDSFARWALFEALTRLTFDGLVSREQALDLLDRFERERSAEAGDPAWEGWQEAVVYLGFEQLHDRLRQAWSDGRMAEEISDLDYWERQIAVVRAMRPGDAGLLERERFAAITDIDEILRWVATDADLAQRDAERRKQGDPAAGILRTYERHWLEGFLSSKHVPETAMTVEAIDGYFTALAVCPSDVAPDEYWPALWNYDAETDAQPSYDSDEQEEYVCDLLARYLQAVKRRIMFGYRHPGLHDYEDDEQEERDWAAGFLRGVALRAEMWGQRAETNKDCMMFMGAIYALAAGNAAGEGKSLTPRERAAFYKKLPTLILNLYREWRGRSPARQRRASSWLDDTPAPMLLGPKIGRNEPCPCGSGKKYKRCCAVR
jgi:uncharacterized protein